MEIKQLNNYKIKFYSKEEWKHSTHVGDELDGVTLGMWFSAGQGLTNKYAGLVTDVNEDLAEKIVNNNNNKYYIPTKYANTSIQQYLFNTAFEAFQVLSNLPYCVIIKQNI